MLIFWYIIFEILLQDQLGRLLNALKDYMLCKNDKSLTRVLSKSFSFYRTVKFRVRSVCLYLSDECITTKR